MKNAVAYGSGKISVGDMVKIGFIANIIGIAVINIMMATWGDFYFDLSSESFKDWSDAFVCE